MILCLHAGLQDPSYFLAYAIFKERGLDVLPVASIDNDWGITPQTLDAAIGKLAEAKRRVAFVYLVPTHNNPTGTTDSPKKRRELINQLKKNDKVETSSGIFGTIVTIKDGEDEVTLRTDDSTNSRVRVRKTSISRIIGEDDVKASEGKS